MHKHTCTHKPCTRTCTLTNAHTGTHDGCTLTRVHTHTYVQIHVRTHIHAHVHPYTYSQVHVCAFTDMHTHRSAHTHTTPTEQRCQRVLGEMGIRTRLQRSVPGTALQRGWESAFSEGGVRSPHWGFPMTLAVHRTSSSVPSPEAACSGILTALTCRPRQSAPRATSGLSLASEWPLFLEQSRKFREVVMTRFLSRLHSWKRL